MPIKTSRRDVFWSYAGYFFNISTSIIIIPFTLRLIPGAELGLWYTFLSVGALVNLLDFGFSNTLVRNITYAWCGAESLKAQGYSEKKNNNGMPNYRLFISVLKACRFISICVATAALLVLLVIGTKYITFVARNISGSNYIYAWYVFIIAVFLNIYFNYWTSTLKGVGAIEQSQKAIIISRVAQIVFSVVGLLYGFGVIALAMAYLISGFVLRISSKHMLYKYQDIQEKISLYDKEVPISEVYEIIKLVWFNAKKVGLVSISAFAITQSTTLISAAFIDLGATASYGLSLQIISVISGISQTLFTAMIPKMTDFQINCRTEDLNKLFSTAMTIFWMIYFVGMLTLLTVGLPFVNFIKSNTELPFVMVSFMGLYQLLETNHSLFATYISISNKIPYVRASLVSGVLIVIFSLIVAKYSIFGIYGLMSVQFLVQLCYNNWKWPYVVMKKLKTSPWKMYILGLNETYKMLRLALVR